MQGKTRISTLKRLAGTALLAGVAIAAQAMPAAAAKPAAAARPAPADEAGRAAFRDIYREMIETDTSITSGSCTLLADKIEARLRAAGYGDSAITRFAVPDHPKEGGIVAVLPGTNAALKPLLLLGHIDVVTAKREDWTRNPYQFIEEGGYFYGRGTADMKMLDAVWLDAMIRFRHENYHPARTIKLAFTCGEETSGAFNGAQWLAKNKRDLIDAEFALNEGGGGHTDGKGLADGGHLADFGVQVGEKAYQDFTLVTTNPGGHSSQPVPLNALYSMARALDRISAYEFPLEFSDTTRAFFKGTAPKREPGLGKAMLALVANPADHEAEAIVNKDRELHSLLRTTCVATMINGGHALNALPQRVTANVNCRMFPGRTAEETKAALVKAIADPSVSIDLREKDKPIASPPPLDPKVIEPMRAVIAKHFPGVPLIPYMLTGATDGVYLEAAGIPTYGVPAGWENPGGAGEHGLNEHMEVAAAYAARSMMADLIKAYTAK